MQLTLFAGYPDLIGRKQMVCGSGSGPALYNSTTGDPISIGYNKYIDCVLEIPEDPTGTYYGVARPNLAGPRATWAIFYFATSNSAPVANGTNLSAINFVVSALASEF